MPALEPSLVRSGQAGGVMFGVTAQTARAVSSATEPYWGTWVFLGSLAAATGFALWMWWRLWPVWRSLLPAPLPEHWMPVKEFAASRRGRGGLELGVTWLCAADPGAMWSLSWDRPDELTVTRRVRYPTPGGFQQSGAAFWSPQAAGYAGGGVLFEGVTSAMAWEIDRKRSRLQTRSDGADHVLEFLLHAGAVPTAAGRAVLATPESQAWFASRPAARDTDLVVPAARLPHHARVLHARSGPGGSRQPRR